jgi:hypothetical protein
MDSILDRLDFYENPKCAIWHANVTQVVSFLHILARLPQKVEIASHASCSHSTAVPRSCARAEVARAEVGRPWRRAVIELDVLVLG